MANSQGLVEALPLTAAPTLQAPRQNWILDPVQDMAAIILAPLLVLALALLAFATLGAVAATALIITTHIVMTVAHHLPTFIRIYGDLELFGRHRATFIIAPLLPFSLSMSAGIWLITHDLPIENLLYVFLLAVIWDPWHFLMQHYGFMRLYDRHNAAPRRIAARMDLLLCASWFIAIMLAAGEWLAGLLEDLYQSTGLPLLLAFSPQVIAALQQLSLFVALAATAAYAVYLLWCRRHRYFISRSKLALFASSFGVMLLTYTPNALIESLAPGWSFKAGFAAVGIVHMTQYLAIVWRYNRGLAAQSQRARPGWFQRLHARGGWIVGVAYVALCLGYGELLTTSWDSRWLMALLISLGLTSTLMHYYFDGFIWKLRQPDNRGPLDLPPLAGAQPAARNKSGAASRVTLRQLAYFGLPLTALSVGAWSVWQDTQGDYLQHLLQAQKFSQAGRASEAASEAQSAFALMNQQLPIERRMVELRPSADREAKLALLIYNQSRLEHLVLPSLAHRKPEASAIAEHRERTREATSWLRKAIDSGQPLAHAGRPQMNAEGAQRLLAAWLREIEPERSVPH
jgi:hypothetical protein